MKMMTCALMLGALMSVSLAHADRETAQKVAKLYAQGQIAEKDGNFEVARACYEGLLALEPKHGNARHRLLNLRTRKKSVSLQAQKRKLEQIVLNDIVFTDASLKEAVEALSDMIEENAGAYGGVNFVVEDPRDLLAKKKVNIQLKRVPASVILGYILNQTSATARYDEYAVVIRPLSHQVRSGGLSSESEKEKAQDIPLNGGSRSIFD